MADIAQHLEPHLPRLRRYARTLVRTQWAADDLVQSTMLRALDKQHLYRIDTNLHGWLMAIMHNEHVNTIRRQVRGPTLVSDDTIDELSVPMTQEAAIELREVRRAVARLPKSQREPLLLHWLDGIEYGEIARRLNLPIGTVQSRIWRAPRAIRAMLN